MTDGKGKKHAKGKNLRAHVGEERTDETEVIAVKSFRESSSEEVDVPGKMDGTKKELEIDRCEMEKIEALCKQFGVPDPGELYIIPRDFSGTPNVTQFDITMPEGLARWVDEAEFEFTIGKINAHFARADEVDCRTVWNGICKFLTCFMIRACQKTRTERAIIRVKNFIIQQNQEIYHAKGFHIVEPAARGLRHIEFRSITYYSMKYFLDHEDEVDVTESEAQFGEHAPLPHHYAGSP